MRCQVNLLNYNINRAISFFASGKLDSKKSSKENRLDLTSLSKRQLPTRKTQQQQVQQQQEQQQTLPTSRRVLKENKANKKATTANNNNNNNNDTSDILDASGVGVQTIISLPVINPMKSSDSTADSSSGEKKVRTATRLPNIHLNDVLTC